MLRIITGRFSLLKAAEANARLESGAVVGNLVLLAPKLLKRSVASARLAQASRP